ncbi:hypothetical protein [Streptomyces hawaiiensis]|uniref:hypothetical protein n=1 Tax=Streptomyces hawaiiensis TaxID=67305 RepID=UPI00158615C5|nr:hypothetical protein [Streptomyces hawaiiensis]
MNVARKLEKPGGALMGWRPDVGTPIVAFGIGALTLLATLGAPGIPRLPLL